MATRLLLLLLVAAAAGNLLQGGNDAERMAVELASGTLPPSFWMWQTTAGPPPPPGPNPNVVWVPMTEAPLPTTAPELQACYGCECLFTFAPELLAGGDIADKFVCKGGALAPKLRWAGQMHSIEGNSDGGHSIKPQSFALVVEDLDYPYGVGEAYNRVFTHYAAWNIPGNYTSFDESVAAKTYKGLPIVTVGVNDAGRQDYDPPCPTKGLHRIRVTLWALRAHLDVPAETPFREVLPKLEYLEMARSQFMGNVLARPQAVGLAQVESSKAFLRRIKSALR